ncbi:hypothetical protein DPMN_123267 [Dreissena polymorpha]|uniref:Uncharacterized protein n=1 Tax=Dreissena polymorpha TaxID=45954 RepID=A0A9D4GTE3_DREPO|nr:hypothetical protein DPMN_123267 [Dreissena polymorpha]
MEVVERIQRDSLLDQTAVYVLHHCFWETTSRMDVYFAAEPARNCAVTCQNYPPRKTCEDVICIVRCFHDPRYAVYRNGVQMPLEKRECSLRCCHRRGYYSERDGFFRFGRCGGVNTGSRHADQDCQQWSGIDRDNGDNKPPVANDDDGCRGRDTIVAAGSKQRVRGAAPTGARRPVLPGRAGRTADSRVDLPRVPATPLRGGPGKRVVRALRPETADGGVQRPATFTRAKATLRGVPFPRVIFFCSHVNKTKRKNHRRFFFFLLFPTPLDTFRLTNQRLPRWRARYIKRS